MTKTGWPVVQVSDLRPSDLAALADVIDEALEREQPFALALPEEPAEWQRLLDSSPEIRRRLRRRRAALGTWCAGVAQVVPPGRLERMTPLALRQAEVIWGCRTAAFESEGDASRWLRDRLEARVAVAA